MSSGYKLLDDAIVEHVSKSTIHPIYTSALLLKASEELGINAGIINENVWRLIDRRMQALRKAGRLVYVHKGKQWKVAIRTEPATPDARINPDGV